MPWSHKSPAEILKLLEESKELPIATKHFPSRGQSAVQKLFVHPSHGKLFYKQVSKTNHSNCQVNPKSGTLAERELWSHNLATHLGLKTPKLVLLDEMTTLQNWLNLTDAKIYRSHQGPLEFELKNIFECSLFDWLTGQIDRHDANFLYNANQKQITLIDSAHSFLKYDGSLPDYLGRFETEYTSQLKRVVPSKVLDAIKDLPLKDLQEIVPLRCQDEMMALFFRFDQLKAVKTLNDLIGLYRGA